MLDVLIEGEQQFHPRAPDPIQDAFFHERLIACVCRRRSASAVGAVKRRSDGAVRQDPRGGSQITSRRTRESLLARLADNESTLVQVCDVLTEAIKAHQRITPAAEWLVDNFYLIEEQIATAKRHLPRGYSRELPRLRAGPSAGLPRVYDIACSRSRTATAGDGAARDRLRRGLPDRQPAAAGRAVGDPDHAAAGADREPAPRRRARGHQASDREPRRRWADRMIERRRASRRA